MLSEATETDYALWKLDVLLRPLPGFSAQSPTVTLNGVSLPCQWTEDGLLSLSARFHDPSYRPVDYDGEDIGLEVSPP